MSQSNQKPIVAYPFRLAPKVTATEVAEWAEEQGGLYMSSVHIPGSGASSMPEWINLPSGVALSQS